MGLFTARLIKHVDNFLQETPSSPCTFEVISVHEQLFNLRKNKIEKGWFGLSVKVGWFSRKHKENGGGRERGLGRGVL